MLSAIQMGGEEMGHCVEIFRGSCLEFLEADLSPKERKGKGENRHRKQRTFQVKLKVVISTAIR